MIYRRILLSTLLVTSLVLTGCQDSQTHKRPEQTILGVKKQNRPDWISDEQIYSEQGLYARDAFPFDDLYGYADYADTEKLAEVFFSFDKSNIESKERAKLKDVLEMLKNDKETSLLVVGHCDWHGTHEYNLALGDRRANSVEHYLEQLGADRERIKTLSKGDLEANVKGTIAETQHDRRSDVILLKSHEPSTLHTKL